MAKAIILKIPVCLVFWFACQTFAVDSADLLPPAPSLFNSLKLKKQQAAANPGYCNGYTVSSQI